MKKILFKLFLFLIALFGGIYLSIPFLIETTVRRTLKETPYEIDIHQCTCRIGEISISEIQLTHKETREKIVISDLSFAISLSNIFNSKILFNDFVVKKIIGFNTEIEHITGQGEFLIHSKRLVGKLNSPSIQSLSFETLLQENNSFFIAVELDELKKSNFIAERTLITMNLDDQKNIRTHILLKNAKVYSKDFGNVMISGRGKLFENLNIREGVLNIFSSLGRVQGNFDLVDKTISYKVYSEFSIFDFLKKQNLIFEGQYSLLEKKIHAMVKSYHKTSDYVGIEGQVAGDFFSSIMVTLESFTINKETLVFPESKKKFYVGLNPFSVQGDIDILITDMDKLGGVFLAKSSESFLRISGKFEKDKYWFNLTGKKLLFLSLFKTTDFNISLNGVKGEGSIDMLFRNKEKTDLNLKTRYVLNDEKISFPNALFYGIYRETPVRMEKSQIEIFYDQRMKGEIEINIGHKGKFFLTGKVKNNQQEFSIKSDNVPITIFNNVIKDQNIAFEDGLVNMNCHYIKDFLNLTLNITQLKTALFEKGLGNVQLSATIKPNIFKSDVQAKWGEKTLLSLKYTTTDFKNNGLSSLYHPLKTAFECKGNVEVDGFSDVLHMHDDILSGSIQFFAEKKENEPISVNINLKDGYFVHAASGVEIKEMIASIKKPVRSPETVFLLEGYDDGEGKIFGEGKFLVNLLKKEILGKGRISLSLFKMLNLDRYQGSGTGFIDLILSPEQKKISGNLKINNLLGYMVPKRESEIFDIKVISEKPGKNDIDENSQIDKGRENNFFQNIILDIRLDIPNTLRFYGSGLESTWGGNLNVSGAIVSPNMKGRLNAIDGHFIFVGKKLPFIEGSLIFTNGIDPQIRVSADTNAANISAKILYHGSLSDPKLELVSIPVLPREEILSQVMFSKNAIQVKSLSQIIQLADAIAIFSGNPSLTGFLDEIQKVSGVDEIGIREDAINALFASPLAATGGGVLSVAKNLNDNLFIRGERTLSAAKSRAILGIKLIPDVSLELITEKPDASQWDFGIGLEWKKDY